MNFSIDGILDYVGDIAYIKDINGVYINANKNFRDKHADIDIIGKKHSDFPKCENYHYVEALDEMDQYVLKNKTSISREVIINNDVVVFLTQFPYFDTDSNMIGIFGIGRNIAREYKIQKELEETHVILQSILNCAPVSIFWKDINSVYLGCNLVCAHDFNLKSTEDVIGKTDYDLSPKEYADQYVKEDKEIIKSKLPKLNYEEKYVNKDGKTYWSRISKVPLISVDGEVKAVMGIYEDITELKLKADSLEKLNIKLEKSNSELEEYAYIISHDLKSPLRHISNYLEFIQEDPCIKENHFLTLIDKNVSNMFDMIEGLLEYSLISHHTKTKCVNIKEIVEFIVENFKYDIECKNITIEMYNLDISFTCVGEQIIRLFQNLIHNAIKYSNQNGKISISLENNIFCVQDNGIGIPNSNLDKAFKIFSRMHSGDLARDGNGLGLAICKKIIDNHFGKIWIESEENIGTKIFFTLANVKNNH
jgi:PAS domain S-box-containing protein